MAEIKEVEVKSRRDHTGNGCNYDRDIELSRQPGWLSITNKEHRNDDNTNRSQCLNVSHPAAMQMRDALNEMYPLSQPPAVEPTKPKTWKGKQAYKGNGKHTWEKVAETKGTRTVRLRVPGGWLYTHDDAVYQTTTTTFVPMPDVSGSYPI
jgi:hypothetical protein